MFHRDIYRSFPYIVLHIILIVLLNGCGSFRKAAVSHIRIDRRQYIEQYSDLAREEMKRTGIPASIILAQALLESNDGNSYLAIYGNNHFGIKCHKDWNGKKIYYDDDKHHECFRKYNSVNESFRDHSDFIRNSQRYAFLFSLGSSDFKGWAKGLKKAGYATNPHYARMLIKIIEENELHKLDDRKYEHLSGQEVKEEKSPRKEENTPVTEESPESVMSDEFVIPNMKRRVYQNNRIEYIIVKPGDTFESLTKEMGLLPRELYKYNELDKFSELHPGQILYLQPKRKQAVPGKEIHIAKEGDTMYSISQKYGIKLKSLYEMNGMKEGEEPAPGQKIKLRK